MKECEDVMQVYVKAMWEICLYFNNTNEQKLSPKYVMQVYVKHMISQEGKFLQVFYSG